MCPPKLSSYITRQGDEGELSSFLDCNRERLVARGAQLRNRAKQTMIHQDITLLLTNMLSGEYGLTTNMDFSKCVCRKAPLKGVAAILRWCSCALEATEGPLPGIGHVE